MADQGKTADIGYGVTLSYDSQTYYVLSVDNAFNLSCDDIENAHSGITDKWKEFFAGLKDAGEVGITINHNPDHVPTVGGTNKTLTLNFPVPSGKTTGATFACSAYVKTYSGGTPVGDKKTAQVTWKLSGKPTWTPSA